MSLLELIEAVEADEMTLTVYNADPDVVADLKERFADRHVVVTSETTDEGTPREYVTLSDDGIVRSAVGVGDLLEMFETSTPTALDSNLHRPVLDNLQETLFSSWDPSKMLTATREIEDRAWRVGRGRLHVGFQNLDVLRENEAVYTRLADSDLDIHCYSTPNGDVPSIEGIQFHIVESEEIEQCWFLVYDGGGDDDQKCALLAQEREERSYYGFWTYDPETVDLLFTHLKTTYNSVEHTEA